MGGIPGNIILCLLATVHSANASFAHEFVKYHSQVIPSSVSLLHFILPSFSSSHPTAQPSPTRSFFHSYSFACSLVRSFAYLLVRLFARLLVPLANSSIHPSLWFLHIRSLIRSLANERLEMVISTATLLNTIYKLITELTGTLLNALSTVMTTTD